MAIAATEVVADVQHGASIAVNGVCLTVVEHAPTGFTVDVMAESLDRSSLGALQPGSAVNLERAVRADGRLDGHIVQGHVDGVVELLRRSEHEHWTEVTFGLPSALAPYIVEKGSVALDGVSLTVASVGDDEFSVCLIPTTLSLTTLGARQPGDPVNVEVDVLAKYVERMIGLRVTA
ncbi:riboflavin synthase subunit alpha [Flexivirga endophytica]|uniref:Riboflavin synthase n=1 Tax=Flexivirga endophytica TaxID=1849103 RepID=A0A916T654_9MICO|nr:riboflavin synthase subunit alpha [Flexivirga endophytica]GHB41171.1 riboflavin synthase subunit alpha [Flexivirga endophytica]